MTIKNDLFMKVKRKMTSLGGLGVNEKVNDRATSNV